MRVRLLSIILITSICSLWGQNSPYQEDIKIGAMLDDRAYYSNYNQLQELGADLIFQRAIVSVDTQRSNFSSLLLFNNLVAMNDSGEAIRPENRDWIYYYTNAMYSKWEAEGNNEFDNSPVGLKPADWIAIIGDTLIHTGTNASNSGKYLFRYGPNYSQYMRYIYTNKQNTNNPPIQYQSKFWLKLLDAPENNLPVCSLFVSFHNTETGLNRILAHKVVYADSLSNEFQPIDLNYDYRGYYVEGENEHGIAHGPEWLHLGTPPEASFFSDKYKVEFQIQWLGHGDLFVDYIEVCDSLVWDNWFNNPIRYLEMINAISAYNQQFAGLGEQLKHYFTVDEPHSLDCQEPIRKIQFILDSLNINRDLITHFYPGWNNYRDSIDILQKWNERAEPKKINFWYFPFQYNDDGTEVPDDFTLSQYAAILQRTHLLQSKFWVTAQAWGYLKKDNQGNFTIPYYYKVVSPEQVGAQAMLALAHGVRGIIYEPYYSYIGWNSNLQDEVLVTGVVDLPQSHNFPPRPIYYKIQQIANRINGLLGNTLNKLTYTGHSIHLKYINNPPPPGEDSYDYLFINQFGPTYHWHAGFFTQENYPDNKYFLLTNLRTGYVPVSAELHISNNTAFENVSFKNIEGGIDTTIVHNSSITYYQQIPAGEGLLYRVSPVILYGGKVIYDESTQDGMSVLDTLIINNNAVLTILGTYNAYADIIVRNGTIAYSANGKINFYNGAKLIIEGSASVLATNGNKLELDFMNTENNSGIVIMPGGNLYISYCVIKNAAIGIQSDINAVRLFAENCDFVDCGAYSMGIFGLEALDGISNPPVSQILNCTITGSSTGIYVGNLPELVIKQNHITGTDLGISLVGIVDPLVANNTIISTRNCFSRDFITEL